MTTIAVPGPLCYRGHDAGGGVSMRWPKNRTCVECQRETTKRYRQTERGASNTRALLRRHRLRSQYGITPDAYEAMLASQGGGCAICGRKQNAACKGVVARLAVDHCHDTKKVRGILCTQCNQAIGQLNDDPCLADKLAAYLRDRNEK